MIYEQSFDDWQEFLSRLEEHVKSDSHTGAFMVRAAGGLGFHDACGMFRDGWSKHVDALREATSSVNVLQSQMVQMYNVVGDECDIGRYSTGDPECMFDYGLDQGLARYARIMVDITYPHTYEERTIVNFGLKIAKVVDALVLAGVAVELWVRMQVFTRNGDDTAKIALKVMGAGENMHLGRLAFAIAHPAMLRYVMTVGCELFDMSIRQKFKFYGGGNYGYVDYAASQHDPGFVNFNYSNMKLSVNQMLKSISEMCFPDFVIECEEWVGAV